MKKMLILGAAIMISAIACKKSTTTPKTPTTTTPAADANPMEGNWNIKEYDNLPITSPGVGTYNVTKSSATTGTVSFDLTQDGKYHYTETDSFTMSASNTKVDFIKTGGNFGVLSGGKTWTIDSMTSSVLRIKSQYGLTIRMTK